MGRLFRRRLLEQVTATETGIEGALWELEEHGLIYQERVLPEEEYSFKHVLTQEAVYQSVLRRRRTLLHQKVAEAIEALDAASLEEQYEQLAYHYERSEADEKAITYLLKVGEKARRAYLNEEAIDYFQRALDRLDGRRPSVLAAEGTVKGAGPRPLGKTRQDWRVDALRGLGETYCNRGKLAEAERHLREAIALGQEIRLAAPGLVRLYWWLTNVLFWQGRYDEEIQIAAEGQMLLGGDTESVEAALVNHNLALGYSAKGDYDRSRDFCYRNAKFLQRLPYLEELLLPVYHDLVQFYYFRDTNVEEAVRWVQLLERKAEQHHGLATLGVAHKLRSEISLEQGDLRGAISHAQRAWERYLKVGDYTADVRILALLGWASLSLGELQGAEEYIGRWLDIAEEMGYRADVAGSNLAMGSLWLCQGSWANATEAFQKAARLCSEIRAPREVLARLYLGRTYLAQRQRREALRQFQQAMALLKLNDRLHVEGRPLPGALSGLEEAYEDPESFRAFCCRFREEHPEVRDAPSVQWFLESTEPLTDSRPEIHDLFVAPLSSDWSWHDPFRDCSLATKRGLEIHAANGRGLGHINLSAPRLLRPASGDFTVQTVCVPVSAEKPAIGGLLFWKGRENFLRLDRGTRGAHEVSFLGCLGNKDMIFGRGRLTAERVFLRLERWGDRVNALCSADGRDWFTVGATAFPLDDPVQVGLHAIGSIDRTVYPGSYPEGTAIRFAWFQLCRARL
jgi:tetratricopeptide (TPR) repeat protein/regulation of enolase protein 1 (concanavalin A-like superfamily)